MIRALQRRWFLLALGCVLCVGLHWAVALFDTAQQFPRSWIVAAVMFMMALSLETEAIYQALVRPQAVFVAIFANLVVLPLLAWLTAQLLPEQFGSGLVIAAAAPCTLASAAVWTRRAGGNDAVALLVTLVTNLACFLVTPLTIALLAATSAELDAQAMAWRLLWIAVMPVLAAQLLRRVGPVGTWATQRKTELSFLCQLGILVMVWLGAVHSGAALAEQDANGLPSGPVLGAMLLAVGGVHLAALAVGCWLAYQVGEGSQNQIAVAFAGSQKTLMVGLDVAILLTPQLGGLILLPVVAFHVIQLILDTLLAERWRQGLVIPLLPPYRAW